MLTRPSQGSRLRGRCLARSTVGLVLVVNVLERFAFHGVASVYVVFAEHMLGASFSDVSIASSLFNFGAYGAVVVGGYVADAWLGRRRTLLSVGGLYLAGLIVLSLASSPLAFASYPVGPTWALAGLGLGLALVAVGAGTYQSSVAPFATDQLGSDAAIGTSDVASVSHALFWSTNIGAVLGMLVVPLTKRAAGSQPMPDRFNGSLTDSVANNSVTAPCADTTSAPAEYMAYYASFGATAAAFALGLVVLGLGRFRSARVAGGREALVGLARDACRPRPFREDVSSSQTGAAAAEPHDVDASSDDRDDVENAPQSGSTTELTTIEANASSSSVAAGELARRLSFFAVYWFSLLLLSRLLILQTWSLNVPDGVTIDQLAVAEPAFIVLLGPPLERFVLPRARRAGWPLSAETRVVIGFALTSMTSFVFAAVQSSIPLAEAGSGCASTNTSASAIATNKTSAAIVTNPDSPSIFIQIPLYLLLSLCELFASNAALEMTLTRAPIEWKSTLMSWNVLQVAFGALAGLALAPASVPSNFVAIFLGLGALMFVWTAAFAAFVRRGPPRRPNRAPSSSSSQSPRRQGRGVADHARCDLQGACAQICASASRTPRPSDGDGRENARTAAHATTFGSALQPPTRSSSPHAGNVEAETRSVDRGPVVLSRPSLVGGEAESRLSGVLERA